MHSRNVLIFSFILFSNYVFAGGESGISKIEKLYQRSSDGLLAIFKYEGNWANPDDCDKSDRLVLEKNSNSRAEFYSAILASKMSKSDFSAYLSGCVIWNGVSYPKVIGVYTY